MICVDPIRDDQKIQTMKTYLKGNNLRDHALFVVGINVALRITDLLALKWADVFDEKGKFKEIRLFEGKTQEERRIQLNRPSQRAQGASGELRWLFHGRLPLPVARRRAKAPLAPASLEYFERCGQSGLDQR